MTSFLRISLEKIRRMTFWTIVFWIIMALGLTATAIRFTQGLGAATHLSDKFPWGLWIGFDVLCGVGLAAGGFVVAATVYIFNLDYYKPILRPAVLTAFLGYLLVMIALFFDLGRPWQFWHPMIMWNPHSVMFEVFWCVIFYTTVLALEFSPLVFERFKLEKPQKALHAIIVPLVILGVILSSLHQSSLGSLYLIVPEKVYPLWYSANLPYLFFLTAIAVGPAMVTIESFLSSRAFKREIELPILAKLGKVTAVALSVYLVLKIEDVVNDHLWPYVFTFNLEGILYWAEILLGVIVPIILLTYKKTNRSAQGLFYSALFVVLGFILNRMNLSITSIEHYAGVNYFPSWMEISITLMIVAAGFAGFRMAVKYLPVFPEKKETEKPLNKPFDVVEFIGDKHEHATVLN
ncbi:MAG: Ni/Fe-hydrogenase cytochrome b subunit [Bacteroidota bacterium]|nr:Ni/Fe-hydrogenase cytochrome b subunit [Bacteroidota bacterium]